MARTRTLATMRSDIRIAADCVNQTNRHPDSELTRWINESIQQLRQKVALTGIGYYNRTVDGTVSAGNGVVTFSGGQGTNIVRVLGVDLIDSGRGYSLQELPLEMRNDWGGFNTSGSISGPPEYYTTYDTIGIFVVPNPDAAYTIRVHFIATHTDLSADGDTFDGIAGWEDWVRWDVCVKIAIRDKNMELYQTASAERENIWAIIASTAPRRNKAGGRRIDTRGRRLGRFSTRWRA